MPLLVRPAIQSSNKMELTRTTNDTIAPFRPIARPPMLMASPAAIQIQAALILNPKEHHWEIPCGNPERIIPIFNTTGTVQTNRSVDVQNHISPPWAAADGSERVKSGTQPPCISCIAQNQGVNRGSTASISE